MCEERFFACLPQAGFGTRPATSSAMAFRWFGMMTKNTLPVIQVAMTAPVCSIAARPEKTCWKAKAKATTVRNTALASRGGRLARAERFNPS